MQEATREQEAFAQDKATIHARTGVTFVAGKEWVFVTGEYAVPGREDEYRWEDAWIVMPDGTHAQARVEYAIHEERTRELGALYRDAERIATQEPVMCRIHTDTPAISAYGLCRDCLDRNYEAEDIAAAERSR